MERKEYTFVLHNGIQNIRRKPVRRKHFIYGPCTVRDMIVYQSQPDWADSSFDVPFILLERSKVWCVFSAEGSEDPKRLELFSTTTSRDSGSENFIG